MRCCRSAGLVSDWLELVIEFEVYGLLKRSEISLIGNAWALLLYVGLTRLLKCRRGRRSRFAYTTSGGFEGDHVHSQDICRRDLSRLIDGHPTCQLAI